MRIPITIETHDRSLSFKLFDTNVAKSGMKITVPGDATLELGSILMRKAFGIAEVLQLILDASLNVEYGLIAAWLFSKVENKPIDRITIGRRVVTTITKESIQIALEEESKSEK
jgi:hypothetical protein